MNSENPYQSPESESTPERAPLSDLVHRHFPSWRFWVLALICVPGLVVGYFAVDYVVHAAGRPQVYLPYVIAHSVLLGVFATACLFVLFGWRYAARQTIESEPSPMGKLFLFALCVLSMVAAPSAFMSICGPVVGTVSAVTRTAAPFDYVAFGFGLAGGAIGLAIVILLARGIHRDAVGRPKTKADDIPERLIPRLRARRPSERQ